MTYDPQSGVTLDPGHEAAVDAEIRHLEELRDRVHRRKEERIDAAPAPAWRQPEVEKIYQRWMADHYGEVDMELLCSAMFNAGCRTTMTAMVAFGDLMPQLGRMESRFVSTFANMRSVLESLTAEDR